MKTNSESSLCHGLRSWPCWSVLFLMWLTAPVEAGEPKPPEKIKSIVLEMVAKPGVYYLNQSATIDAAFKAAGGWKPCSSKGCWPPRYCILKIRDGQGVYGEKFKIAIQVDRNTGQVMVTDPEWETYPLPENSLLEMPHILF